MIQFSRASFCRSSGEDLADARLLLELTDSPFPGIYPASAVKSKSLRSPLRVVQARKSGLVQLAHVFNPECYREYRFASAVSPSYTAYLQRFAQDVAATFPRTAAVMEVGCGDGTLLRLIQSVGFTDVFGIDPGQPAGQMTAILPIASGYFPGDVPAARRGKKYDLIVARHVLEHLEMPREFVASVAMQLKPAGQLWIEVPDLACTVHRRIWSNFYQIHCSYFEAATLDGLLAEFGLTCCGSEVVEIFGGSLLHRYQLGSGTPARGVVAQWEGLASQFSEYRGLLGRLAEGMPAGCVGYGAAERTAVALGACPTLEARLSCLYDGNPLLAGRFLGGTSLPIFASNELFRNPPSAIVLFAISHVPEVIAELKAHLPGGTPIGLAGADFRCLALDEFVGA